MTAALRQQYPLQCLRRDNAKEYKSAAFLDILTQHNVRSEYSCPYEKHQNGHAEVAIKTIVQTARSLMVHSHVPPSFWGPAMLYASDIRNAIVKQEFPGHLETACPFHKLWGKLPNVSKMWVF